MKSWKLQTFFFFYVKLNKQWMNPPLLSLFLTNLFMMKACFTWVLFFLFYAAITAWNYTTVKLETTEFIAFEFLQQSYHAFLAQLHSCSNIGSDISITRPFSPTHEHTVTEKRWNRNCCFLLAGSFPAMLKCWKPLIRSSWTESEKVFMSHHFI